MRSPSIPPSWPQSVQAAILQVIALAQYALAYTRSWAANSPNERIRLVARAGQLEQEVALLREEIRIKDARAAAIPAARRPHYSPTERLAILALRAARGWSVAQTARAFQVTEATIAAWGNASTREGQTHSCARPRRSTSTPSSCGRSCSGCSAWAVTSGR
jgi:hypothetical protein